MNAESVPQCYQLKSVYCPLWKFFLRQMSKSYSKRYYVESHSGRPRSLPQCCSRNLLSLCELLKFFPDFTWYCEKEALLFLLLNDFSVILKRLHEEESEEILGIASGNV